MQKKLFPTLALVASVFVLATSCTKDDERVTKSSSTTKDTVVAAARVSSDEQLWKDVKNATSRFHSTTQAVAAGYIPENFCVSVPGVGGMGMHWANPSLVDGVFDPLKPEAVLYAPGPDGKPQLIALEYIVMNTGQAAPSFGSQPFDVNGVPGLPPHWSLHVWLYKHNPAGMFQPFNPDVSCQ